MKHKFSILTLSLLLGAMAMPAFSQVSNDNEDEVNKVDQRFGQDFVPGQVLVKMKESSPANVRRVKGKFKSAGISQLDAVLQEFGVENMEQLLPHEKPGRQLRRAKAYNGAIVQEHDLSQLYLLQMKEDKAMETHQLIERLAELPEVEFAEPNYKAYIMADVNSFGLEPLFSQLWGLTAINMPNMWRFAPTITQKRPVIALLDTGVDITHPDLAANIWTNTAEAEGEEGYDNDNNGFRNDVHGWDFINQTGNIRDFNGHGTHCAGIAAAIGDNHIGLVGANPDALIMPITIMQSDGTGDLATIIRGIDYAIAMEADILSMSIGTYATSSAFEQALGRAYQNAILVAAAGNDGYCLNHAHKERGQMAPMPMFPAAYNFVLGVQASTSSGAMAGFSNYDDDGAFFSAYDEDKLYNYELRAPGASIMSIWPGGKYRSLNGTSMACPLVAGALSRLIQCKDIGSKEELFGDLIHSKTLVGDLDIYAAYQMSDANRQPTLSFVTYTIDDSEGDGDGLIDAGEIIAIYPTLRNDWGIASNIQISVELDALEDPNIVEFLDANVAFGNTLSGYAKNIATTPLRIKINEACADNRHIKLRFGATCNEANTESEKDFILIVNNITTLDQIITEDLTLTADKVYYAPNGLGIPQGITLTIEPGTRIEIGSGSSVDIQGHIVAKGEPGNMIVFTGHNGNTWQGISTYSPADGGYSAHTGFYMNADSTKFTVWETEETPIRISNVLYLTGGDCYYSTKYDVADENRRIKDLYNYDFLYLRQEDFTNPDFLTPLMLQFMNELKAARTKYSKDQTAENTTKFTQYIQGPIYYTYSRESPGNLQYCIIENTTGFSSYSTISRPLYMENCVFRNGTYSLGLTYKDEQIGSAQAYRCNFLFLKSTGRLSYSLIPYSNVIGCKLHTSYLYSYNSHYKLNYISNYRNDGLTFGLGGSSLYLASPSKYPSYLGTAREDIIRPYIYEAGNVPGCMYVENLTNMPSEPIHEAHGIVWKVVVNGYDAQDEFEQLPPLGVGRHKFEVYFNRPMNKEVAPQISFGVREPYTQQVVAEDGSWNEEGTIYTAYKTITGKTKSDGLNRIYVYGAEDDEFFEIPYEKTRFNINIQAAGSMATGFMAEAGLGRVNLTWNNDANNFDDAMGFNVYRYTEATINNPTRINEDIVDIETTEFVDYDVTPGTTYYYMYKVLSTDLQEYDVSNVVAATPLTGELGDANGSGEVDVADVITTVNYAAGQQPKPFIFEAADMNTDLSIDILDVIGIIKKIMNPGAGTQAFEEATATYTIENGILYVESPVALAGVQVQLALDEGQEVTVANDLNGFEHTSAWLSDNDYLFLAYNMNGKTLPAGKHALLHIGNGLIAQMRLADSAGHNVEAVGDDATRINRMATDVMTVPGIYDLQGRKITGNSQWQGQLPKGVYIINGKKVVR